MKYDVIVIGAGPAGSTVSSLLLENGAKSVLLLEKERFPRVKPCAGGISPKTLKLLHELGLLKEIEQTLGKDLYPIRGARVVSPSGRTLIFSGRDEAAVAPRPLFDFALLGIAEKRGARVKEASEVHSFAGNSEGVRVVLSSGETFTGKYAVNASGGGSRFRLTVPKEELMTSCMGWYEGIPYTNNSLEMIFDPGLTPHYGWLFPESDTRCNIGICMLNNNRRGISVVDIFNAFLEKQILPRCGGKSPKALGGLNVFPLICSLPSKLPPMEDRCLRVGEAAGLVHPFTGEGISFALKSAYLAAQTLVQGIREDTDFSLLERNYRNSLKRNFEIPLRFSSVMKACTAGFLNAAGVVSIPPLTNLIGKIFSKV